MALSSTSSSYWWRDAAVGLTVPVSSHTQPPAPAQPSLPVQPQLVGSPWVWAVSGLVSLACQPCRAVSGRSGVAAPLPGVLGGGR